MSSQGNHVGGAENLFPRSKRLKDLSTSRKRNITVLQFLVGALVTFGGAAFAFFAFTTFGRSLGIIHFSIGIIGIGGGFAAAGSKSLPRRLLLTINVLTIAYSSLSEAFVEVLTLLPPDDAYSSLIGTIIAIIMSGALIYVLAKIR